MDFRFSSANESDLEEVVQLAHQLGEHRDSDAGFLVSDFALEDYRRFANAKAEYQADPTQQFDVLFWIARDESGVLLGFFLAYDLNYIRRHTEMLHQDTSESRIASAFLTTLNFYVIKQIGIAPVATRRGLGREFYRRFAEHTCSSKVIGSSTNTNAHSTITDVFVAVLTRPENARSVDFHRSAGFESVILWTSEDTHDDGVSFISRSIMHATSQELLARATEPEAPRGPTRERVTVRAGDLEHARSLYAHEDYLNWVKLSYLSQYAGALLAAQFVTASFAAGGAEVLKIGGVVAVLTLGALSLYLTLASSRKLRSGLLFMDTHKRSALIQERKMMLAGSGVYPVISRPPRLSATASLMSLSRRLFVPLSVLATAFCTYVILS
jgi:hypothetical protein